MEQIDSEVPLPKPRLKIAIVYNLKQGVLSEVPDAEAEYDNIETVYAIRRALQKNNREIVLLEADDQFPQKLLQVSPDIVFNIAEGRNGRGREAQVPAILNYYGIPFTGSDETTLCLALDKALTKRFLSTYNIITPKYTLLTAQNNIIPTDMCYPVILKPNAEGSSKGISDISIVHSQEELQSLYKKNMAIYQEAMLAEEYIAGREFTVGLLGNGDNLKVFAPMEIVYKRPTQGDFYVYSYSVKQQYQQFVDYLCPAQLTEEQETKMLAISKIIFNALECRDFARLDFRMNAHGKIYFIEINPLPGLAPSYSDYPMLAEFCGMEHQALVNAVLDSALTRLGMKEASK